MLKEENNCLERVVNRIFTLNKEEDDEVVEVNQFEKVSEKKEEEVKEKMKELSSLPLDCSTLKSILENVQAAADQRMSSSGEFNVLSFNKPEQNTSRFSNVVNPKALALSNDIPSRFIGCVYSKRIWSEGRFRK